MKAVPVKGNHANPSSGKGFGGKTQTSKGREKKAKEKRLSAQKSIPYREMAKDGRGRKKFCVYGRLVPLIRDRYVKFCCRFCDFFIVDYTF